MHHFKQTLTPIISLSVSGDESIILSTAKFDFILSILSVKNKWMLQIACKSYGYVVQVRVWFNIQLSSLKENYVFTIIHQYRGISNNYFNLRIIK
jgi:hypothetical protein